MNDRQREAFEKWFGDDEGEDSPHYEAAKACFLAGHNAALGDVTEEEALQCAEAAYRAIRGKGDDTFPHLPKWALDMQTKAIRAALQRFVQRRIAGDSGRENV